MDESVNELYELIKIAREKIWKALTKTDIPAVKKALKDADLMLHWSLWHLALEEELKPELEREKAGISE